MTQAEALFPRPSHQAKRMENVITQDLMCGGLPDALARKYEGVQNSVSAVFALTQSLKCGIHIERRFGHELSLFGSI